MQKGHRRSCPLASVLLLLAVLTVPAASLAAEFDRTLPASPGMRLDVRLFGGEVVVKGWDRPAVRVRAIHFETDEITCEARGDAIQVRARTRAGAPHGIDLMIEVPTWMAISVAGPYVDVAASGVGADVSVETVRGDIRVDGGRGLLALSSIEGHVVLEGARGTARLRAASSGIRVAGLHGTLHAETVEGSVRLLEVAASRVEVSTVGGDILWEGPLDLDGSYHLATHSGDIDVTLPHAVSATLAVYARAGNVRSRFAPPLPQAGPDDLVTLVLGAGRPLINLESFNGIVSLRPADARRQ